MENLKSEGVCYYCNKTYNLSGIGRHLSTHLKALQNEKPTNKKSYHVKVTSDDLYFLHLLIGEKTKLEAIDSFLRQIWLECCGHMSSFEIEGKKVPTFDDDEFGLDRDIELGSFAKKGMKLVYDYDFGSTTRLELKIINEYFISAENEILLLSRNEPIEFLCDTCGKESAKTLCTIWHEDESMFCESCGDDHAEECIDYDDYSKADVVNSPRMGVCGYAGGRIDLERDGVWQK